MPSKININDLTLAHKGSDGTASATLPDMCKTPTPGGPVPLPYPNIAMSADLAKGTTTIKVDGGNMAANKGSELSRSTGDEAGTVGGVVSSTFIKEATWMLYSFDVMLEGKNACRLTDKLFMNHQNTVCMQGWLQNYMDTEGVEIQDACKALGEYIDYVIGEDRTGEGGDRPRGTAAIRGLQERMIQNRGLGLAPGNPGEPPGTEGWANHDQEIDRLQTHLGNLLNEYEADCKDMAGRRDFNERMERGRNWENMNSPQPEHWQVPINEVPLGW